VLTAMKFELHKERKFSEQLLKGRPCCFMVLLISVLRIGRQCTSFRQTDKEERVV
jgi:hypothetical protein